MTHEVEQWFDLWPSGLSVLMGRLRSHLLLHCCMADGRWCSRHSLDGWPLGVRHWTERISWPRPHLAEHWDNGGSYLSTKRTQAVEQRPIINTKTWVGPRINQKPVLPLPRDPSPTEGGGIAAGYSAPWRWAGHVWSIWNLADCHRSHPSCTRPHGACSQDRS